MKTIDELVNELAAAKKLYDRALLSAFQAIQYDSKGQPRPLSEERAKLAARTACAEAGVEDPEVLRWRLRARIGYRAEED